MAEKLYSPADTMAVRLLEQYPERRDDEISEALNRQGLRYTASDIAALRKDFA